MCSKLMRVSKRVIKVNLKRPLAKRIVTVQYIPQAIDLVCTQQVNMDSIEQMTRDIFICECSSIAIQTALVMINVKRVQNALKDVDSYK